MKKGKKRKEKNCLCHTMPPIMTNPNCNDSQKCSFFEKDRSKVLVLRERSYYKKYSCEISKLKI